MARVLKGSHTFTCTPRVHPPTEWTIPAFAFPAEAGNIALTLLSHVKTSKAIGRVRAVFYAAVTACHLPVCCLSLLLSRTWKQRGSSTTIWCWCVYTFVWQLAPWIVAVPRPALARGQVSRRAPTPTPPPLSSSAPVTSPVQTTRQGTNHCTTRRTVLLDLRCAVRQRQAGGVASVCLQGAIQNLPKEYYYYY